MMKNFYKYLLATLFVVSFSFTFAEPVHEQLYQTGEKMVYVCTKSDKAYAYHTHADCRHIKRCWEEDHIQKMTISKARSMHRSFCKTCAKRDD